MALNPASNHGQRNDNSVAPALGNRHQYQKGPERHPKQAGDIRERPFREIWERSELFRTLRDFRNYGGACGRCRYLKVCGGCRARAYALSGDDLAEEPYCSFGESVDPADRPRNANGACRPRRDES